MINVSGHLRNERRVTGFADDSVSLSVNCCGMQVFKTKSFFSVRKSLRSIPIMQMSTLKSIGFISPGITVKI